MIKIFLVISSFSFIIGVFLRLVFKVDSIGNKESLLICGLAWIFVGIFAALPFYFTTNVSFLDAYFETISGLTTTGITIYTHIGVMSKTVIFWRSLIQWIGGLGILTLFIAITYVSNSSYFILFSAESHKIDSPRPTPNIKKTVIILWGIYLGLTLIEVVVLKVLGVSLFDSINHTFTTLSTGGFSPYDSSINFYHQNAFKHFKLIEYTITFFMFLGGMNFLLHYKFISGKIKEVIKNTEFKYYVFFIIGAVVLILINHYMKFPFTGESGTLLDDFESKFRSVLFTVVSILTTTGYGTVDINSSFFPQASRQILLVFMIFGGSVGSTGGGIKVIRIVVLYRMFKNQIRKLFFPKGAISEVVINNSIVPMVEIKRITGLFLGWLLLLLVGGVITAFFTDLTAWQSFSGMFSALGNIGPAFFSVKQMSLLPAVVKITYIIGMLAGRLELLPIILLFNRRAWQ